MSQLPFPPAVVRFALGGVVHPTARRKEETGRGLVGFGEGCRDGMDRKKMMNPTDIETS
jgi:hypothetical protein